jgi:hypothetical protein
MGCNSMQHVSIIQIHYSNFTMFKLKYTMVNGIKLGLEVALFGYIKNWTSKGIYGIFDFGGGGNYTGTY